MATNIVLIGGGTGGHIYSAVALAEEFTASYGNAVRLFFMGTDTRLDSKILPQLGYYYHGIPVEAPCLDWKHPNKLVMNWAKWASGIDVIRARKFLLQKKIELVIGLGSYISAPILVAAKLSSIPYCLVELDARFGQSNRFFSRWAACVFTSFNLSKENLPKSVKLVHTGFISRESLYTGNRNYFIKKWGLDPNKKTITILGGSLGSRVLNKTLLKMLLVFDEDETLIEQLQFVQIVGNRYITEIKDEDMPMNIRLHIVPFVNEMNHLYALSDLIIARAGASTIAEIINLSIPAILIPWAGAKHNHQTLNAELVKSCGGGIVLSEETLDFQKLAFHLRNIILNDDRVKKMKLAYKTIQLKEKATSRITREAVQVI